MKIGSIYIITDDKLWKVIIEAIYPVIDNHLKFIKDDITDISDIAREITNGIKDKL